MISHGAKQAVGAQLINQDKQDILLVGHGAFPSPGLGADKRGKRALKRGEFAKMGIFRSMLAVIFSIRLVVVGVLCISVQLLTIA